MRRRNNTFSDQAYGFRARAARRLLHLLERRRLRQPQHRRERHHDRERLRGARPSERHDLLRRLFVRRTAAGCRRDTPISAQFFVDRHKGNFEINGGYLDVSPNYDPIDGYTANSDIRGPQFFTDYAGASPAIKNYSLFFTADRFLDESGAVHQADVAVLRQRRLQEPVLAQRARRAAVGQLRSYAIPRGPGCTGPILFQSSFTRLSLLSRRRHAAVQPLPDSGRLPRRHAVADRRELFVGAVRRQLRASIYDRYEPPAHARG